MRKIFTMVALITMLLYSTTLLAQTVYYVQSVKARVVSSPSFKSKVVVEVNKGFKVISIGREGSWVKVKIGEKEGFISSLLLSTQPPLEKTGIIKAENTDIKQGVRRRASSYTSAAAARGLAADDRRRLSKEEKVNYEALEKMETFTVSADEIGKFMEVNKI